MNGWSVVRIACVVYLLVIKLVLNIFVAQQMLRFKRLCANFCPPKIQAQKCVTNFESVWTFCRRLTGEQLQEDDRLRQEVIASIYFPRKYLFWNLRKCCLPKYSKDLLLRKPGRPTGARLQPGLEGGVPGRDRHWGKDVGVDGQVGLHVVDDDKDLDRQSDNDKNLELVTIMIFTTTSTLTIQEQTIMTFWQVGVQS